MICNARVNYHKQHNCELTQRFVQLFEDGWMLCQPPLQALIIWQQTYHYYHKKNCYSIISSNSEAFAPELSGWHVNSVLHV